MQNYFAEKVQSIRPVDGRRVHVVFADGFEGDVDLTPLLDEGPLYAPLRDEGTFREVTVSRHGVPTWPGDFDLSPGSLRAWCEAGRLLSIEETDQWVEEHSMKSGRAA